MITIVAISFGVKAGIVCLAIATGAGLFGWALLGAADWASRMSDKRKRGW